MNELNGESTVREAWGEWAAGVAKGENGREVDEVEQLAFFAGCAAVMHIIAQKNCCGFHVLEKLDEICGELESITHESRNARNGGRQQQLFQ